jgi:hypothetical protein
MDPWVAFVGAFQARFRRRRSRLLREHCPDLHRLRVLDLGGSRHFWEMMPADMVPADLTLLNIEDDGSAVSHTGRLDALKVELYDGTTIPYPDGHFDVLICNSVIEHVPPAQRARFCGEALRVSKRYFIQTPAYAFPIEPHFVLPAIHWLPRSLGRRLIPFGPWALLSRPTRAKMDSYFDNTHLLTARDLRALLPGARLVRERLFGLTKSYTAHGSGLRARQAA